MSWGWVEVVTQLLVIVGGGKFEHSSRMFIRWKVPDDVDAAVEVDKNVLPHEDW